MPELKITPKHLEHDAYLYIRQSTPRQVLENTESTQRQYALRDRAVALGWPLEHIHVIDCDLGKSGSQSAGRDGFQKLVSEVALGKAGLVMGLEVSRWHGTRRTGTGSSRCVRWPARSFSTRMESMTRRILTTGFCLA